MRGCERAAGPQPRTAGAGAIRPARAGRCRPDRGFVTAETAVVLPVLVAFAMALVWGLLVMAAQIQCVDAARTGARAAARQDPDDAVLAVAREAAPGGARVTVGREAELVRVVVVAEPPLLHGLPFEVRAEAVASAEQAVGTDQPVGAAVGAAQAVGAEKSVGAAQVAGADS
ncbi:pilus assembly protein [Streptomyces sp. A108]|nr:TadE family type IV pilus minor pilin [Streptomyces sp. A108]MBU6531005.1 pilus assembly protein [Streptomyces sp. A108]